MYPLLRLARVLLRRERAPPRTLLDEHVVHFRAGLLDIDTSLHLNNGRYLTMMDLGRIALMRRAGILRELARRRWMPVVHSSTIRHVRPIDAFVRYELRTKVVGWDDEGIYLVQRFFRADGKLAAVGAIRGVFLHAHEKVSPAELARAARLPETSPPLPDWIVRWQASLQDATRERHAP